MKKTVSLLLVAMICNQVMAQNVAINNSNSVAHPSALLDVSSSEKGMLVPRMNTTQRNTISSPATGLLVYDTDINSFMYFNGSAWSNLAPAGAPGAGWNLGGNAATDSLTNYVGTSDSNPLFFRINNLKA